MHPAWCLNQHRRRVGAPHFSTANGRVCIASLNGRMSSICVPHLRYALLSDQWVVIAYRYGCVPPGLGHGRDLCHGTCRRQLHTERAPEGAHVILIAWLLKLGSLTRPRDGGSWRIKRKTSIGVVGAIGVWCFQCHSKRKPKLSCHRRRPLAWMNYF